MGKLIRDGVALFSEDAGRGAPPILFIHGLGGDHTHFAGLFDHFRRGHRVVAVDLRGHGQSDAPQQAYTVQDFADDLAWMCYELGLYRPVFVGHGLGGVVAIACAAQYPDLSAGLVVLDAPLVPTIDMQIRHQRLLEDLRKPGSAGILRQFTEGLLLPQDEPASKARILDSVARLPPWIALSVWESTCTWDISAALAGCKPPLLYLAADPPYSDLVRLRTACPQATIDQTVGFGHYGQLEATGQLAPKIERFLVTTLNET